MNAIDHRHMRVMNGYGKLPLEHMLVEWWANECRNECYSPRAEKGSQESVYARKKNQVSRQRYDVEHEPTPRVCLSVVILLEVSSQGAIGRGRTIDDPGHKSIGASSLGRFPNRGFTMGAIRSEVGPEKNRILVSSTGQGLLTSSPNISRAKKGQGRVAIP